jgi:hypothetical protein
MPRRTVAGWAVAPMEWLAAWLTQTRNRIEPIEPGIPLLKEEKCGRRRSRGRKDTCRRPPNSLVKESARGAHDP